jgi:hypothetical protein
MLQKIVPNDLRGPKLADAKPSEFTGFQPPSSNATYTPNQFFDVCIRHSSRGVVRLVSYLIRKNLGWCDEAGKPQEDQIHSSYVDLIRKAGISRDMIRKALDEAQRGGFVTCSRNGQQSRKGDRGQASLYELKWDNSDTYHKDPKLFPGFFEGEGNRTYIPNEFFDVVVKNESLSVIRVVGAIMRSSIGFEAKRGYRRQKVALSYKALQNFTGIKSRRTLSEAIHAAIHKGYIVRIAEGVFSPDTDEQQSAIYAPRWADSLTGQIWIPGRSEKDTRAVRKGYQRRSETNTRSGPISKPANRSEKDTTFKMKQENETNHKQDGSVFLQKKKMLEEEGVSTTVAAKVSSAHSVDEITQQITWLPARNPQKSRPGLLVAAIENNYASPTGFKTKEPTQRPERSETNRHDSEHQREAHMARFSEDYLSFLRTEESRVKQTAPKKHARFLSERAEERAALAMSRMPWATPDHLKRFDSERARLTALCRYFRLRDFWDWDQSVNPKPINSIAARLPEL